MDKSAAISAKDIFATVVADAVAVFVSVTECRNFFLCYCCIITACAVLTLCETCFSAGRSSCFIDNEVVTES